MAVPWGFVIFAAGLLYGYMAPGRQDKVRMLRTGLLVGVVLAAVLVAVGFVLRLNPLGLGTDAAELLLGVVVLSVVFVLGAWLGDLLEGAPRRS